MAIFYSPMKLIALLKETKTVEKAFRPKTPEWFSSAEGEKAYKAAKTLTEKTEFFLDYFIAVRPDVTESYDVLYRAAYIMASAVDGSSLPYARYPDILDSTLNPIVRFVRLNSLTSKDMTVNGLMLLAEVIGELDTKILIDEKYKPHELLTYCSDGKMTDEYKLEREIIGMFCDASKELFPPYVYDAIDYAAGESVGEEDDE